MSRFEEFTPSGEEYSRKAGASQINLAKKAVDAGADAVVGSHPHVLQEIQLISLPDKTVPVFYSLGNFFNWSIDKEGTSSSVMGVIDFNVSEEGLVFKSLHAIPIAANKNRNPELHKRALLFVTPDKSWKLEQESINKSIQDKYIQHY